MCSGSSWQRQWQKCLCSVWSEKASRLETSFSYQIALHIHCKLSEPLRKLTSRSPFPLYIFLWIDWSRHFFAVQLESGTLLNLVTLPLASTDGRHNLSNNSTKQTHAMILRVPLPFKDVQMFLAGFLGSNLFCRCRRVECGAHIRTPSDRCYDNHNDASCTCSV